MIKIKNKIRKAPTLTHAGSITENNNSSESGDDEDENYTSDTDSDSDDSGDKIEKSEEEIEMEQLETSLPQDHNQFGREFMQYSASKEKF